MMKEEQEDTSSPVAVPEASPEANDKQEHDGQPKEADENPKEDIKDANVGDSKGETSKAPPRKNRRTLYLLAGIALIVAAILCITLPLTLIDDDDDDDDSSSERQAILAESGRTSQATELPLFGPDITNGYGSSEELEIALAMALRKEIQAFVADNIRQHNDPNYYNDIAREEFGPMTQEFGGGANEMAADAAAPAASATGNGGVTDFETNNQEENVDEADSIKADENFVYAAFGDYIVVWDLQGNKVAQVAMPPIDLPDDWGQPPVSASKVTTTTKSMVAPDYMWTPKPHIQTLLLTDNHLIALVTGYNDYYYDGYAREEDEARTSHVLYNYRTSQIRLYEKTGTGDLTFRGKKDVNGNFVDARSMGNNVHIATASGLDLYTHLWGPLARNSFIDGSGDGKDISDEDYTKQAYLLAEEELIPQLTRKLAEELALDNTQDLPSMLQINQWMTEPMVPVDGNETTIPFGQYDIISNVAQVTSFNVEEALPDDLTIAAPDVEPELTVSASAYMAPSYFNTLYGATDHLVLATSGWDWNATSQQSVQTTYLVALEVDGPTTQFKSLGTLKGHLLNQYALDVVNNELRAATTVENFSWWGWGGPRPMPFEGTGVLQVDVAERGGGRRRLMRKLEDNQCVEPTEEDTCNDDESYAQCMELADAGCPTIVQSFSCPPTFSCLDGQGADNTVAREALCPPLDDACVDDEIYRECMSMVEEGCTSVLLGESCPYSIFCENWDENFAVDPLPPTQRPTTEEEDVSRTENYMTVMTLTPGTMTKKGDVKIGEKHERITAVRFFDEVAYAVTFERTDPFYSIGFGSAGPEVLGELKLPGFSEYLHSMNPPENTMLLAVGQNATDDGVVTGLMVTVFDATNPSAPKAVVSHTFENQEDAYSSSSVSWDYKAFRYIPQVRKLVIPLDIWYTQTWNDELQDWDPLPEGSENFQGFGVLDIQNDSITEEFRVSHAIRQEGTCYYCGGYLPTRSFVYSGDLMTVRDNVVVSTNLATGEKVWDLILTVDGEKGECCW